MTSFVNHLGMLNTWMNSHICVPDSILFVFHQSLEMTHHIEELIRRDEASDDKEQKEKETEINADREIEKLHITRTDTDIDSTTSDDKPSRGVSPSVSRKENHKETDLDNSKTADVDNNKTSDANTLDETDGEKKESSAAYHDEFYKLVGVWKHDFICNSLLNHVTKR